MDTQNNNGGHVMSLARNVYNQVASSLPHGVLESMGMMPRHKSPAPPPDGAYAPVPRMDQITMMVAKMQDAGIFDYSQKKAYMDIMGLMLEEAKMAPHSLAHFKSGRSEIVYIRDEKLYTVVIKKGYVCFQRFFEKKCSKLIPIPAKKQGEDLINHNGEPQKKEEQL